jgi:DNA-binding CsgD family transcriptional regulator
MTEPTSVTLPRFLDKQALDLLRARLRLSRREGQIVECMFRDAKESTIARRLDMSPHTLRTHIERLYRKLRVNNRMELVIRLYESFLSLICESSSPLPPLCSQHSAGRCPLSR